MNRSEATVAPQFLESFMMKSVKILLIIFVLLFGIGISSRASGKSMVQIEREQRKNVTEGLRQFVLPEFSKEVMTAVNSYETADKGLVVVGKTNLPVGSTLFCLLADIPVSAYSQVLTAEVGKDGYFETEKFKHSNGFHAGQYFCRVTSLLPSLEKESVKKALGGDLGLNLKGKSVVDKGSIGKYVDIMILINIQEKEQEHSEQNKSKKEPGLSITNRERSEALLVINKFINEGLLYKVKKQSDNYVEVYVLEKFYSLPIDLKEGLCAYPFTAYCDDEMCAVIIRDGRSGVEVGHFYLETGLDLQ